MNDKACLFARSKKYALLAVALLSAQSAFAVSDKMSCKVYEQQEQANIEAQKRADPSIHGERFDTVFFSPKRNSCMASVFFTKGVSTYAAIIDIPDGRMLWAKSYKGISPTPARIVEMDQDMDDEIKALESGSETADNSGTRDFLPLLLDRTLDRTMNTLPAIKNVFTEER
jgi:hypothetical protein